MLSMLWLWGMKWGSRGLIKSPRINIIILYYCDHNSAIFYAIAFMTLSRELSRCHVTQWHESVTVCCVTAWSHLGSVCQWGNPRPSLRVSEPPVTSKDGILGLRQHRQNRKPAAISQHHQTSGQEHCLQFRKEVLHFQDVRCLLDTIFISVPEFLLLGSFVIE